MRKFAMIIMLGALASGCGRAESVASPKADRGLELQRSCALPGDTKAEVAMLDNLDEYRKSYGLWPLSRNCALSELASNWVQKHPEDDTYDVNAVNRGLKGTNWINIGFTLRVKATASDSWERMLVEPTDFVNLKRPTATDVGVAVEHEGGQTWVYFITVAAAKAGAEFNQDL
jgi:hypothetical protein